MITLGVVDKETSEALIRRMYDLAMKSDRPREVATLVKSLASLAKLELEANKEPSSKYHLHLHDSSAESSSVADIKSSIADTLGFSPDLFDANRSDRRSKNA